jgi:catechol 2,3-dioxygenase-like lactoylglutathione lyase family enzyme
MARAVHHLDLWVRDVAVARAEWGWLLGELDWAVDVEDEAGMAWRHDDGTYVFLQGVPEDNGEEHDRMRPGVNHIALTVDDRAALDRLRAESSEHGWHELFADRYPHAGGEEHVALYVENSERFEVEIVVEQ